MIKNENVDKSEFLDVKQVAGILKKAVKTVYNYVETERIPSGIIYRIGNSIRIRRGDLDNLVEERRGI